MDFRLSTRCRGFTLLELLIVIAVLGVLLAIIVPSLASFRQKSILNTETQELVTVINRARLLSVSSKNDDQFGVHFDSSHVVLFQGSAYIIGDPANETHTFDSSLTLSSTVTGGGSNVVFEKVTGATSQNATTTLLVTSTTASSTVLVYPSGIVTIF